MEKELPCITSVGDFLELIKERKRILTDSLKNELEEQNITIPQMDFFFRGHDNSTHALQASLFRKDDRDEDFNDVEHEMCNKLFSNHSDEFLNDRTAFERLVRMRHYGLPTRLLDITSNPLIALFFSCAKYNDLDGSVYIFILPRSNVKTYNSDTVSIIANLSNLNAYDKERILKHKDTKKIGQLAYLIKRANSIFYEDILEETIENDNLPSFIVVESKLNNKRIQSQSGAFILFKDGSEIVGNIKIPCIKYDGTYGTYTLGVIKAIIPAKSKVDIKEELDLININEKYLYQDISHTAKYIKETISKKRNHFQ